MKKKFLSKFGYLNKRIILLFCLLILKVNLFSQNIPPAIEWQKISWADEDLFDNFQPQENSGEEWWYSHKNIYTGSTHTGYISVGYSSTVITSGSYVQAQNVYNEGANSCYNPIGNFPIGPPCTTAYNFSCVEDCGDRDYVGEHRGPVRGMVALNDLNGVMTWCKPITAGEIQEVVQDGNFIYVVGVHYGAKPYNDHSTFLAYNPTVANPNNYFDNTAGTGMTCFTTSNPDRQGRHFYMAKLDLNGNIIWQNIYGLEDFGASPNNAFKSGTYGYDLIKSSNGNIIACGNAYPTVSSDGTQVPFIVEVNPTNGYVIQEKRLPVTSIVSANGTNADAVDCHTLAEFGTSQNYAIGSTYIFNAAHYGYTDYNEAVVWVVDQNMNPISFPLGVLNPIQIPGDDPAHQNSNIWELKYHQAKNEMMLPVIMNCQGCFAAGDNRGECRIYRYELNGAPSLVGTNPSLLGEVGAFDLRAGVEETPDGGFVVASTKHTYPGNTTPAPTSSELGYLDGCTSFTNGIVVWDTDPIVAKYNSNGDKMWETSFDVYPGRPRQPFPNDIKRQECLYKISVAQDGGYVVSGNCSYNFDDSYLFKLYNDCNSQQSYTVSDPTDNIIDITTNTTWTGSKKVIGVVHIISPATLTIASGAVIEFADSKLTGITTNIDVESGAQLKMLSNSKLTSISACANSMWDGVIIEGTPFKQISANQGKVVLTSCTIENARRGVFVGGRVKRSGGILQATTATFKNNYTDVEFFPYNAPLVSGNEPNNISFFSFCNFIGDAVLNDPTYTNFLSGTRLTTNTHVILRGVKGIQFSGNKFKTDLTGGSTPLGTGYQTDLRSMGIYSIDASFNVHRACNIVGPGGCAGAQNTFDNLFYGVYAQSTSGLKTFTVDQTNFTNCYFSLYQSGTNYSTLTKNNFLINTTIPAPIIPVCSGSCPNYFDYTNQCSGFLHSENSYVVTSTQKVVGSIFNKTGTSANESYHNYYTGLKIGTQAQQTNGVNATPTGLQIRCNENSSVITSDIASTSGVIPNQGGCGTPTSPAGNEFSSNTLAESDIKVSSPANNFIYSYQQFPLGGPQVPVQITPVKVTANPCGGAPFIRATSCPLPVPCGIPCWFALVASNNNLAISARVVLQAGNDPFLYTSINSSMSAGTLKTLLISRSPYLSDGVLIAYLQRTITPPAAHIKDVIIANSPVTTAVKTVLDNMSLPNGIRNQINAAQIGTSARKQQEDLAAYYDGQKQLAIDASIRLLLNDTIIANTDSIIERLLKFDGTIKGKTDLTNLYISKGEYASAQQLIDSISTLPGLDKHGKMLQHHKNLHQTNKDWFEINNDAQIKTDIEALAIDSLADGFANARSVFAMVNGAKNYDVIEDFIEDRSPISNTTQDEVTIIKNSDDNVKLSAYPNPFKDELNVTIDISQNIDANTYVQLIEPVTGRVIQQQLISSNYSALQFNTENLSSGMYLIGVKGTNINPTFIKLINIR